MSQKILIASGVSRILIGSVLEITFDREFCSDQNALEPRSIDPIIYKIEVTSSVYAPSSFTQYVVEVEGKRATLFCCVGGEANLMFDSEV